MTNIRSAKVYKDSFWDWTFLNDCFIPTKIKVSDVEGMVERHGHFLWIETKFPDEDIELGQEIMHKAALKLGFTILYIWGKPNAPEKTKLLFGQHEEENPSATSESVQDLVRRWFTWANNN